MAGTEVDEGKDLWTVADTCKICCGLSDEARPPAEVAASTCNNGMAAAKGLKARAVERCNGCG